MKANTDKREVKYVMPTRELVDGIFKSESELDKAIFGLVLYCTRFMTYDMEIMASEQAQDAATHGLLPRQILYFFRSYELPDESYQERYAFLDKAREHLLKHSLVSDSLMRRESGKLKKEKLNKHLSRLVLRSVLNSHRKRYFLGESLLAPVITAYYKRMLAQVPTDWMVPSKDDSAALIIYNSRELRKRTPDKYNDTIFRLCKEFSENFEKVWTDWPDKPIPKPTVIITPGRIFDEIPDGRAG